MTSASLPVASSIRALRAFVAERPSLGRCGLCGASITPHPHHAHLFESKGGRVVCACGACSLLFSADAAGPYRQLPVSVELAPDLRLTEADWRLLGVPIRLAFFTRRAEEGAECIYPSPAGPVRSPLDAAQVDLLAERYVGFRALATDVEALLVVDVAERAAAFRLPLDECFRLVGLVRRHWRGASGGASWWSTFDTWLAELRERAEGRAHG